MVVSFEMGIVNGLLLFQFGTKMIFRKTTAATSILSLLLGLHSGINCESEPERASINSGKSFNIYL